MLTAENLKEVFRVLALGGDHITADTLKKLFFRANIDENVWYRALGNDQQISFEEYKSQIENSFKVNVLTSQIEKQLGQHMFQRFNKGKVQPANYQDIENAMLKD